MSSPEDLAVQLELKERLNYPEYLENALKHIESAFSNEKISMSKVQAMILNLFYDIPDSWYNDDFVKDIEGVITTKEVPNIIKFCNTTLSQEYMKQQGIPLTKKVKSVNFFKMKNAIINLLDSLNMLVRKDKIERSTGKNLKYKTLDEMIEALEKADEDEELEI